MTLSHIVRSLQRDIHTRPASWKPLALAVPLTYLLHAAVALAIGGLDLAVIMLAFWSVAVPSMLVLAGIVWHALGIAPWQE